MMYAGKRIEVLFEYLPEDTAVAEAFFKFTIPKMQLEQLFLFTGNVIEPKVSFVSSRVDFHSVMLGGQGVTEYLYIENNEHIPFNFQFDRHSLLQLESGTGKSVIDISPLSGTVGPHSKTTVSVHFQPQEEIHYNFNVLCEVKRKPNKLSVNIKGEGYAVHPLIQVEHVSTDGGGTVGQGTVELRPQPAVNILDFGTLQVLDTLTKSVTVTNIGKYNFDYAWETDGLGNMLSLSGAKMRGTLLKGTVFFLLS
jgi:hydrocephalus-inducing protein